MTETLDRALRGRSGLVLPPDLSPRGRPREPHRPLGSSVVVQGALAAVGAAVVAIVVVEAVVLLAWAGEAHGGARSSDVLRLGLAAWLLALHTRVHSGGTLVGVAPLGLTFLCLALVAGGAARMARARWEAGTAAGSAAAEALRVVPAVAVPYGAVAGVVAGAGAARDLHPSPVTALVGGLTVGLLGSLWGVHRARRSLDDGLRLPLPRALRLSLSAGVVAAGLLVLAGSLLAVLALGVHAGPATGIARALGPGAVGGATITVLQAALAPNAAVWGVAWLAGPGFAVGAGTSVTPVASTLGQLPALPLLAALPRTGSHGPGLVVTLVPVLCALVAAALLLRRGPWHGWPRALQGSVWLVLTAGVLTAALAAASGGPVGGQRLLTVGPSWWHVGLAVAAETAIGCALALAGLAMQRHRPGIVGRLGLQRPSLPSWLGTPMAGLRRPPWWRLPRMRRPSRPRRGAAR